MMSQIMVILLTAFLSSFCTLAIVYFVGRGIMRERAEYGAQLFIKKFKEEVGPVIEERVKKGVKDGFSSLASREVIRDTTRNMARTGADIVGDTLKPLLKSKRRPSRFDNDDN